MNKPPLWILGFACIFGGVIVGLILPSPNNPSTAAERGFAFGKGIAQLGAIVLGVVLIVVHVVRRK